MRFWRGGAPLRGQGALPPGTPKERFREQSSFQRSKHKDGLGNSLTTHTTLENRSSCYGTRDRGCGGTRNGRGKRS
jgi:hypothetical protein